MKKIIFLIYLLLSFHLVCISYADEVERSPTVGEVQVLFDRLTKSVPDRMYLQAEEEIFEKKATEPEILLALNNQEKLMVKEDGMLSIEQKNKLREFRLNSLRERLSGHRIYLDKIWVAGRLYRGEQENTLNKATGRFTFVNIGDPTFANGITGFAINKNIKSASVFTNATRKFAEIPLWQAYTVEPDMAFAFLLTIADKKSLQYAVSNAFTSSFAGYKIDFNKANALILGKIPEARLIVKQVTSTNAESILEFIFTSRIKEGVGWRYWMCMGSSPELRKVQVESSAYTSVRESYDTNGFPHYWMTEEKSETELLKKHIFRFQLVDLHPDFDNWKTFGPTFPTNYNVAQILPDGRGVSIQGVPGAKYIPLEHVLINSNRTAARVIIAFIMLLPIIVFAIRAILKKYSNGKIN